MIRNRLRGGNVFAPGREVSSRAAYIAVSSALKQAVGQKKFEEFNGPLWYQAGQGAKEFAETLELATENAGDVEGITHLLAKSSMGPEFEFEVGESTKDRCVGRTTQCPWHKRWKEEARRKRASEE